MTYLCPFCACDARVGKPCPGCVKRAKNPRRATRPPTLDKSADGLDLPDSDFDYDEFVAREFSDVPHRALGLKWYWWLLAVILLVAVAGGALMLG